jgi:hypothetical protein
MLNPRSRVQLTSKSRDSARLPCPALPDRLVSIQIMPICPHLRRHRRASAVGVSNGQGELVHLTIAGAEDIPSRTSDCTATW